MALRCFIKKTKHHRMSYTEKTSQKMKFAALLVLFSFQARAQMITNGDFEAGSAGWTDCIVETGTAITYGGIGSGQVAEVDGNFDISSTDDRILCQTVAGFTIGSVYSIAFEASRRGSSSTPSLVDVNLDIDGGALNTIITRSGDYSMQYEAHTFTATQTTHALLITPLFTASYGMIFDNLSITLVSALPVELLFFNARVEREEVVMSWATATERDNDHFLLERSTDGSDPTELMSVAGAGSTSTPHFYQATDATATDGHLYYRLTQVDIDGTSVLLALVHVFKQPEAGGLSVLPNPAVDGGFTVHAARTDPDDRTILRVMDAAGRMVLEQPAGFRGDALTVAPGSLTTSGTYTVQVGRDGHFEVARLVVP